MNDIPILLEMNEISIEFPGVKALSNVNFSISSGDIAALVGANGAGKSTLMKILAGAYGDYSGSILLNGEKVEIHSPIDARNLGIQIVYQEVDTALIPYLSVAENIMMNHYSKINWINHSKMHDEAKKLLNKLNLNIDTKKLVSSLTLAQKQLVLIARAISSECKFLLLDEPTAPLSQSETQELFRIIRELSEEGVGIVFISHRLPEIFAICKTITILKDGKNVTKQNISDLTAKQVVEYMLNRKFDEQFPKNKVEIGNKLFEVKGLTEKNGAVKDINMFVRSGEIVGIAGQVGAGKTELCKSLFGALHTKSTEMMIKNKKIKIKTPSMAVKNRIALVPEERRKEGVLVDESVLRNLTVSSMNNFTGLFSLLQFNKEKKVAKEIIGNLGIKTPSEQQKVSYLSGGNQQKVVIGKWLIADADIYIFDEPTKGIDVGAKQDIYTMIGELAAKGKGIIYASCETEEVLGISDRVYIMYNGKIAAEMESKDLDEAKILYYSTGGK